MNQPDTYDDGPKEKLPSLPDDGATLAYVESTADTQKQKSPQADGAAPGDKVRYLGDYVLLHEIARGGMGVVFKARQTTLDRIVAVKMILSGELAGETDIERFHAEAQAAAKLDHPGIVPIYEVGSHEGHHYFSMGFIEGNSLEDRIKRGPMPPKEAAEMTRKIASAIGYAHGQGVVHRDLKPANVLIDRQGEPRVTDFGLAKQVRGDSNLTATGQILGTPSYMSPEQAAGDVDRVDAQSDVYALGALLYALLISRPPFQSAKPVDTLLKVLNDEPVSPRQLNPSLPRDLETVCLKCLSKEKDRRYASADDLARDLQRFLNDEPIEARPASQVYKYWRKVKRNRATSLATAAAIVATIGVAVFYAQSRHSASEFAISAKSADGAREALARIQGAEGIHQLAVLAFRNLSGKSEDDWLSAGFASVLETKLSDVTTLKVVGQARLEDAGAELGLPPDTPLDAAAAERLGKHLVVNHVVLGEFQRLGDQIQVSARIVNVSTGAIDQGGMRAQGKFPDEVFDLQTDLAAQCMARLGVGPTAAATTVPAEPAPENDEQPAASIEAWVLLGQGQHALRNRDYDEAIRLLSQAIEADPNLGKAYRALGQAYQQSERNEDAVAAFKIALELDKTDLVSLTYYNLLSGRLADGLNAMARATEAGVADLDVLKMSARPRLAEGVAAGGDAVKKVIDDLKAALKKHPADEELWILLAASYHSSGQKQLALEALEKAVGVRPDGFQAHLYLALAYEDAGQKENAEKQLAEAERHRPPGAAGYRAFGAAFLEVAQVDRAIKEFQRALELEPAKADTHVLIGQAYATKLDLPNSLAHFEKALANQPTSALVLSALCRITNLVQDNARLIKYAKQWAEADADSYEAHQYLRIAYLKTGQQDQAAAQAKLLSGLTPTHESFFFWTGNALIQGSLQNPALLEEAISVLTKGHLEFPENKEIHALMKLAQGMKLVVEKQWRRAIIAFKESVAASPHLARDGTAYLIVCYQQIGNLHEAAEWANRALKEYPRLAPMALEVFKRAKRYDYAAAAIEQAIKTNPTDLRLQEGLINSYAAVGRWDDARSFIEGLPATTNDGCQRRIHLGAMFADRMEWRNRFDAAAKQVYLETLMKQTRNLAGKSGDVKDAFLDALDAWLKKSQPWLVAGPFPADGGMDRPLSPETSIDPDARYQGADSSDIGWRVISVRPGNTVDLQRLFPGSDEVVAYAATYIHSADDQSVTLRFAGRDYVKVWLGDKVILQARLGDPEGAVKVALQKGANRLLIKTIDQPVLDWAFEVKAAGDQRLPADVTWSSDADPELGAARALAHQLRDKLGLKSEVLERLKNDASISEPLRAAALKIAERFDDNPRELDEESRQTVLEPNRDPQDYRLALRQAEAACRLDETYWTYLTTLATAQYRVGQHDDALATLARAIELSQIETGSAAPRQLAVAAMAHHHLGHAEEGREYFTRLCDLMRGEGWARDLDAQAFLREARSVFKDTVPNDNKEATEIEAIKASFVDADEAGWLHQDLDSYMDAWADDARLIIARGEDSGPYDVTSDRQTIQAVHKMVFQAIFAAGLRIDYKKLDVALADETATIKRSTVVRFSGGYETWGGIVDMRKDAGGWKAFKSRSWIVNKKQGQDLTTFDADTWQRLDAEVEKRRAEADLHKLAQAFFDAYRFAEAHQVAKELTSKTDSPASDWTLRGSFALRAADPSDAIAAFKKGLSLDPNAPIPPYDELIVAAPPSLQLTGVDLPADREGSVRSLSSDASAELFVHNGTPYTLDIYWLNFQGQREGRNRVPPGTTWSSSTYLTHPFLVCDTNGRSLGILETKERSRTVSLAATGGKQPPKNAKK